MESPNLNSGSGFTATLLSIFTGSISIATIQSAVSIGAGLVAIVSGGFAIRHYILQARKLKNEK